MEVNLKCKECQSFKDFISYKDRVSFALHIVCHDYKYCHYDKVPFMKKVGRKNILERDRYMRNIICFFFLCSIILVLFMCLCNFWVTAVLLSAIFIMWEYVFIQLHIDDIYGVRVFEMSFNNETRQNLLNMGVANYSNRTFEIIRRPTFKYIYREISNRRGTLIKFLNKITFIRIVTALIMLINRYWSRYISIRQYLLRTPSMYKKIDSYICQKQEVLDAIESKKEELRVESLTVLGIEYVYKPLLYNKL